MRSTLLKTVSVVAGGWSVRDTDLRRLPGTVIGVNDSAVHLPRCEMAVSMDRLWTEYRWDFLRSTKKPSWLRRSAVQNLDAAEKWATIFECNHETVEFSGVPGVLNGTNSGVCALNLAYQLRPEKLYLFGFDMRRNGNEEAYWYDPYPWTNSCGGTSKKKYELWSAQFKIIARSFDRAGIEVVNASPDSAIDVFPKTDAFMKEKTCAT